MFTKMMLNGETASDEGQVILPESANRPVLTHPRNDGLMHERQDFRDVEETQLLFSERLY